MTKGNVAISLDVKSIPAPRHLADGIYLATFSRLNDRVIFIVNGEIILALNENDGQIILQPGTAGLVQTYALNTYSNYRKVKNFKLIIDY